ncbi:Rsp5p-dependent ubiquitination, sorting of cargo proteins at the multivesicular body [Mortierella sp. AM989]|nr:Rsp5p-dependent ubiquitination, sorting of cargo proteins at the multivesicular body [Mortierella sp. AM989]
MPPPPFSSPASSSSSPSSSTSDTQRARNRKLKQPRLQPLQEEDSSKTTWQNDYSSSAQDLDTISSTEQRQQSQQEVQQQQQQYQKPFSRYSSIISPTLASEPIPISILSSHPTSTPTYPFRYPPQFPAPTPQPPTLPDPDSDEDATWLVIFILSTALIITIATAIRSCGQKAGWLTGSSTPSSPRNRHASGSGTGREGARVRGRGHIHQVPDWEQDPDATEERLSALSDTERQAFDAAQAFQIVHPPNSVPTDISLSQYLSIQEKGVSAWEFEASYDHQLFVHDRTELSFFDQVACVQTNLPLPRQQEVYYWEVKMFEKSPNTVVSVGVSTKPYPTTRLPGWNRHSVGYFSDSGRKYCNSLWSGYPYGPIYFEGDVIGCGYRPRNGTIFFTRNGKRIDEAFTGFGRMNLFPTVGATGPCVLHVNFGQSGFVFVEANVKKWGLAPATGSLAPPPAYGSELGSILLEASGSAVPSQSSLSVGRRPILQSSSSRTQIPSASGLRREDSFQGAGGVGREVQQGGSSSSPVQISLANMSAPPPNYSSLDRFGHVRSEVYNGEDDRTSVTTTDSYESATLLLGDAQPDPDSGDLEDDEL